jgi:hypothetical protein
MNLKYSSCVGRVGDALLREIASKVAALLSSSCLATFQTLQVATSTESLRLGEQGSKLRVFCASKESLA